MEQRVIDTLRKVFELNGFIGIETRAVEPGSSLLKKGETSKEIYLLSRLQEVGQENDTPVEDRLGLHFDLTVPLSRYVVEHANDLAFPFKRWQIQKVWRGERPQEGRFREFVQADIDVIGNGELPDHYEVELPLVMVSALEALREFGLPKATVHANNRKLSEGFYRGLGLNDIEGVLREIDKLDKIGADEVAKLLVGECGASEAQAAACLELANLTAANGAELAERFDALCAAHGIATDSDAYVLARQGLDTLAMIVDEAARIRPGSVIADLKIARGLDYYTGSVYETFLDGAASLGSICSGGRYDNLASQGNRKYPGVGLSIGLSRLVSYMLHGRRQGLPDLPGGRAGGRVERGGPRRVERDRGPVARSRHCHRRGPHRGQARQADQVRRQARHSVRVVPRGPERSGSRGRGQEHRDGRPGTGRCQVVGAGYAGCPANRGDSRSGSSMSQTAYRTHHATEVTEALVGEQVTLAGWVDRRRDHGGVAFVDLRDSSGLVQVVINDEEMARPLRSEFVVRVIGAVRLRPEGNENEHLATGKVEVVARSIEILAKSDALPFQVSTALENESENKLPGEDVRLKYRYLDLRRPSMQRNIKLRSDMAKAARQALDEMGFTEVETPTMIKSTPEGARDFLVPARLVPGSWYALPQSPQLLKQLLMVSGVERYYQIARCYRDEDFRADRQPEFTQLDMEMAFVDQEDVIAMAEKVIAAIWKAAGYEVKLPIQRITWQEAMDKYGTDKPDLRFGNELIELTDYFKDTPFRVFQAPYVGAVLFKGGAATPRRQCRALQGRRRHAASPVRRLAGLGQAARRQGPGLCGVRRGRRAQGPGGQEPVRSRARGPEGGRGCRGRRRRVLRRRSAHLLPEPAGRRARGARQSRRPAQARRLRLHLGGGLPAVQVHRGRG